MDGEPNPQGKGNVEEVPFRMDDPPSSQGQNQQGQDVNQGMGESQDHPQKKHDSVISFGQKKPEGPSKEVIDLNSHVAELGRRVRIIEERYSNLRRKTQVTDQNMLTIQKTVNREIKALNLQLDELEKEVSKNDTKVSQITKELSAFAKSDDLNILKRYTEFWEPLAFLTKDKAEKLIVDLVKKKIEEAESQRSSRPEVGL